MFDSLLLLLGSFIFPLYSCFLLLGSCFLALYSLLLLLGSFILPLRLPVLSSFPTALAPIATVSFCGAFRRKRFSGKRETAPKKKLNFIRNSSLISIFAALKSDYEHTTYSTNQAYRQRQFLSTGWPLCD